MVSAAEICCEMESATICFQFPYLEQNRCYSSIRTWVVAFHSTLGDKSHDQMWSHRGLSNNQLPRYP